VSGYIPRLGDPATEFLVHLGREGHPGRRWWRWSVQHISYGQVLNGYTGITYTRIGGLLKIGRILRSFDGVVRGGSS